MKKSRNIRNRKHKMVEIKHVMCTCVCVCVLCIWNKKFFRDSQSGYNEQNHVPFIAQSLRNVKRTDISDSDFLHLFIMFFFSFQTDFKAKSFKQGKAVVYHCKNIQSTMKT